jgi:hypothetical protein
LAHADIARAVISMDNMPIAGELSEDFEKYIIAMRAVQRANLTKIKDAEAYFRIFEEVCHSAPLTHQ